MSESPQPQRMTSPEDRAASPTARFRACLGALASSQELLEQSHALRAHHDPVTNVHQSASHDVSEARANVRDAVSGYGVWLRTQGVSLAAAETAIKDELVAADLTVGEHSQEFAADLLRRGIAAYSEPAEPPSARRSASR